MDDTVVSAGGRPPKYRAEYAEQAAKLCALGATDADLADFFDVSIRTIERWRVEHPKFCRAVKLAKEEADDRVERSLYHKAIGYEIDAEKIFLPAGSTDPVRVAYREKVAPDTAAAIFWLKNRRKDQWRDRIEQDHTHTVTISQEFEAFIRKLNADEREPKLIEATVVEAAE